MIVILSGGFDPVHIGHIRMFKAAKYLKREPKGKPHKKQKKTIVVVGLNSDAWLERKKGQFFMGFEERKEILEAIKFIDQVVKFDDTDDTACALIGGIAYGNFGLNKEHFIFANGGDRDKSNLPQAEIELCKKLGIEMMWGIGGEKIQSSSNLTGLVKEEGVWYPKKNDCFEGCEYKSGKFLCTLSAMEDAPDKCWMKSQMHYES